MKKRMHKKTIFVMPLLLAALLFPACGGGDSGGESGAGLVTISVTPTNPSIANGATQQFTATGAYSDSTSKDITGSVTWSSSDTSVATIDAAGSATSVGSGTTTIEAKSGSVSGNATLTVSDPLTFMEEQLVGKWSRYHAYDDSYQYFIFKSDRTGCYFEINSTGSRQDQSDYVYWKLDEQNPVEEYVYNIYKQKAGGSLTTNDEYHYLPDEIWKGGYSNLDMTHSNTTLDCE